MRYRVAFAKRLQSDGDSAMEPSAELDLNLSDGVVAEKVFVEQLETEAQHSQEVLDEDDAFLGSATPEVWEYEIVDARVPEFEEAIQNSDLVLEFDIVDATLTEPNEVTTATVGDGSGVYPPDGTQDSRGNAGTATPAGSGERSGDDGPAGMPTGDPSAGGLGSRTAATPTDAQQVVYATRDNDDLHVTSSKDPRLGLTNRGQKPAEDWAANTGPARNPDRGVETTDIADDSSTLSRPKRRKSS